MAKNIVLCCDGTSNEFAAHNTNVVKLYQCLVHDPAVQRTYYHPGLGTMEPTGALTPILRRLTRILGLAVGYGLSNDIRDAYVFLMNNFAAGDKLYLFGFSRGAYTARAVASLLHMYGLIRPGNEPLVPYAIRMLMAIERSRDAAKKDAKQEAEEYFALAREFKVAMSGVDCEPWFVGVWDTVSSVGWVENTLKLPYVTNNPDIAIGRHAIAIDERRAFFRQHLWRRPADPSKAWGPQDVKQVWFPGVHCDVGGGYAEKESGLAKGALQWMLREAEAKGLRVEAKKRDEILGLHGDGTHVPPNAKGDLHESLTRWWHIAEYFPKKHFDRRTKKNGRRMNLHRRRTIEPGALVHASAFDRGGAYRQLFPPDAVRED